jgi:hypothetical protein
MVTANGIFVTLAAMVFALVLVSPWKQKNQTTYQIPEGKALRCELVEKSP